MAVETFRTAGRDVAQFADVERLGRQEGLDGLADALQRELRDLFSGQRARRVKNALHGTWLGHPLHAALSDLPVGAWSLAALFDLLGARRTADRLVGVGILAAVPTAMSGMTDWSETEGKQRRVGLVHGLLNSVALTCFIASWLARRAGLRPMGVGLSTAGLTIATGSAHLGGELVYRQGTGVSRTAFEPEAEGFKVAARLNDLPEGRLARAEISLDGQKVPLVLLRRDGQVYALSATCSHWGGPLAQGTLVDGPDGAPCVECPWHASTFDMRDGRVLHGPATVRQPRFETRVRFGNVEVRRSP